VGRHCDVEAGGCGLKRVVVIGAGIAGLAAAHRLVEETKAKSIELDVLLMEKENRLGGTILTEKHEGFVIEGGPDCFLSEKPWALDLAERIGITDRVDGTVEKNKGVFMMWGSKLHPLPEGVFLMVPTKLMPLFTSSLLSWRGKLRMALEPFVSKRTGGKEESLAEFVTRRLGREALERIAEPLVAGIHAGEPEGMSLEASFPRFKQLEDRYGSLVRGMLTHTKGAVRSPRRTIFVSFKDGLAQFAESIADVIGRERLRLGTAAGSIERGTQNRWKVSTLSGEAIDADAVILAAPAHASASIVSGIDPDLSAELGGIPYVGTATVSLAYDAKDVEGKAVGFGFVVPRLEGRRIMAATYSSRKFRRRAPEGKALVRCFIGGSQRPDLVERKPQELADIAVAELADILGIKADPLWAKVYGWPNSMPQTVLGHAQRMKRITSKLEKLPGIEIAGGAYDGLGIPDCVRVGEAAAERILETLFPAG